MNKTRITYQMAVFYIGILVAIGFLNMLYQYAFNDVLPSKANLIIGLFMAVIGYLNVSLTCLEKARDLQNEREEIEKRNENERKRNTKTIKINGITIPTEPGLTIEKISIKQKDGTIDFHAEITCSCNHHFTIERKEKNSEEINKLFPMNCPNCSKEIPRTDFLNIIN